MLWCVKLDPVERPQSVFALQRALRAIDLPPMPKARWPRWLMRLARRDSGADNHQHSLIMPNG